MTLEQARKILNRARDGQDIPRSEIDLALAVTEGQCTRTQDNEDSDWQSDQNASPSSHAGR